MQIFRYQDIYICRYQDIYIFKYSDIKICLCIESSTILQSIAESGAESNQFFLLQRFHAPSLPVFCEIQRFAAAPVRSNCDSFLAWFFGQGKPLKRQNQGYAYFLCKLSPRIHLQWMQRIEYLRRGAERPLTGPSLFLAILGHKNQTRQFSLFFAACAV